MKISLRKANAIQQNINESIRGIKLDMEVSINEFESVVDVLNEANKTVFDNMNRTVSLNEALYSIRMLVGKANSQEIDALLTQIAYTDKIIQLNNYLLASPKRVEVSVLQGKLDKIKNTPEDQYRSVYGRQSEVTTGVFSDEAIKVFKSTVLQLKKDKQKLQDKVLELNIKTEIELPESVVTILKAEDLV